jgi:gamma-glutamyltranspeptidase
MPLEIKTGRPPTLASHGLVTSPHSLASSAGVDVLRAGGSAIDAAIAASAVLAVVYPHMTGLGGDAFWLIHDGGSGEIDYLSGGGKAAARASLASLENRGLREIPLQGIIPATLTVPGAVAAAEDHSCDAHGARSRSELDCRASEARPSATVARAGDRDRICTRGVSRDSASGGLHRHDAGRPR